MHIRWCTEYYHTKRHVCPSRPRLSRAIQQTPRKQAPTERDRFKQAGTILQELQNIMVQCGTGEFKERSQVIRDLIGMWKDKKVEIVEIVGHSGT